MIKVVSEAMIGFEMESKGVSQKREELDNGDLRDASTSLTVVGVRSEWTLAEDGEDDRALRAIPWEESAWSED